jgi:hypothetical protein
MTTTLKSTARGLYEVRQDGVLIGLVHRTSRQFLTMDNNPRIIERDIRWQGETTTGRMTYKVSTRKAAVDMIVQGLRCEEAGTRHWGHFLPED